MATCLANGRWVSKGLYDREVEALDHNGITDVALVGFRGRGSCDVLQPDFCHHLVLESLVFQRS